MLLIDDRYYRATIASIVDMSRGRAGGVQALTRSRRKDLGTLPWRLEPVEADDRTGQQHEREPTPRVPVPPHLKAPPAARATTATAQPASDADPAGSTARSHA